MLTFPWARVKKSNSGGTFFYIINRTIGMWSHLWFWGRWMDLLLKHCFPLRKTSLSILSKIDFCDMGLCCQGLSRLNQTDRQPIRRFPVQTFGGHLMPKSTMDAHSHNTPAIRDWPGSRESGVRGRHLARRLKDATVVWFTLMPRQRMCRDSWSNREVVSLD